MVKALVQIQVEDFSRFEEGFRTRGQALRKKHGSLGVQVFQSADDPRQVHLLFDWESREALEGFFQDEQVKASMKMGGTLQPPVVTLLDFHSELDG